ncbi:ribonuclease E activity regulator RraA [Roseateles koreensis]|uniref:4-hydroxy-4-methyl-2-oxoglutarate aldolase n=1 Tax=Roseateles koreensis TaxID=2987526 RepID=A0ABT5KLJ6_9BURK|nr:ribonuclease E activity regulator RraA [Roseateles koreensis]MDC8783776.1 ribonuclease E activity regulator RraA [Roseateles koreensis]
MTKFSTCDICDTHKADDGRVLRVLPGVYRSYGALPCFSGPVVTVKCLDDNSLVKAAVESPGNGQVLVVDGGGSLRRALLGGNLAAAAARNGWAGLLIDGCVRDVAELAQAQTGIFALGHVPMPTDRKNQGLSQVPVQIQGHWLRPGDWLYADADGVLVSESQLV